MWIDPDQSGTLSPRATAMVMPADRQHLPGERASERGRYEELHVFGTPTGKTTDLQRGGRLPVIPVGFVWRRIESTLR